MTMGLAKSRRLKALGEKSTDRILVKPAAHHSQVHLPDEGTAAAYLIDALRQGCTSEQLEGETGWSKATVVVNLYKVAKKTGVGIRRCNNEMQLMLPKGADHVSPRAKVVGSGSTVNPVAAEVVITPSAT